MVDSGAAGPAGRIANPSAGSTLAYTNTGSGPAKIMADGYELHGVRGVPCNGTPSQDFTVENGIVTHR